MGASGGGVWTGIGRFAPEMLELGRWLEVYSQHAWNCAVWFAIFWCSDVRDVRVQSGGWMYTARFSNRDGSL